MTVVSRHFKKLLAEKNSERRWNDIWALQKIGNREVLRGALAFLEHPDAGRRSMGATILGQLSIKKDYFHEIRYVSLRRRLNEEKVATVFADIVAALSNLHDSRNLDLWEKLSGHRNPWVRWYITCGLSEESNPRGFALIEKFCRDRSPMVRDWAVFTLGTLWKVNSAKARSLLRAHLKDSDPDTRAEAIRGLALRKDKTVRRDILRWLKKKKNIPDQVFEAAELLKIKPPI